MEETLSCKTTDINEHDMLDNYAEKILSVGNKLTQAIGYPDEQLRLLSHLKIYINSMINDCFKMRDVLFHYESFELQSIADIYDMTYDILSSLASVISGIDINPTNIDANTMRSGLEDPKDTVIQKFKGVLSDIDKVMAYFINLNKPAQESTFFDELSVANEVTTAYRVMRKAQTNTVALYSQLLEQKRICKKKYKECQYDDFLIENFRNWLNKQKNMMQRKINGKEIRNKKALQKFVDLYDSYLNKLSDSKDTADESTIYHTLLE